MLYSAFCKTCPYMVNVNWVYRSLGFLPRNPSFKKNPMQRGSHYSQMNAEQIQIERRSHRGKMNWECWLARQDHNLITWVRKKQKKNTRHWRTFNRKIRSKSSHVKTTYSINVSTPLRRISEERISHQWVRFTGKQKTNDSPAKWEKSCLWSPNTVTEIMAKQWQCGLIL